MAHSIVIELQEMASDSRNDAIDLLRKALIVATKLKRDDFKAWVNAELHGYHASDLEIPSYRHITAVMRVVNPFRGLIPLHMPPKLAESFCKIRYGGAIGTVVSTMAHSTESDTGPIMELSEHDKHWLMSQMDGPAMEPVRTIAITSLATIVDAVRSTVLDWALKLEEEGIVGEGMSFSSREKELAASSTNIRIENIENMQGFIGSAVNSQVRQNLRMRVERGDVEGLLSLLREQGLGDQELTQLASAIAKDPAPVAKGKFGPSVSKWMAAVFQKSAQGAYDIGANAMGGVLSDAITSFYFG